MCILIPFTWMNRCLMLSTWAETSDIAANIAAGIEKGTQHLENLQAPRAITEARRAGGLAWFESHPYWVPSLDGRAIVERMPLSKSTKRYYGRLKAFSFCRIADIWPAGPQSNFFVSAEQPKRPKAVAVVCGTKNR